MEDEPQIRIEIPSETVVRRRCLKSETHRTLLWILSHCYDVSQLSISGADQNVPLELNQDNESNELGVATEEEEVGTVELVELDSMNYDDSTAQHESVVDKSCDANGFGFEQTEDLFNVEGNEDFTGEMDVMDLIEVAQFEAPEHFSQDSFLLEFIIILKHRNWDAACALQALYVMVYEIRVLAERVDKELATIGKSPEKLKGAGFFLMKVFGVLTEF